MIGRIQTLDLPSGGRVETPLLVPSVSSRGFDWYEADGLQLSTVSLSLENVGAHLAESLLISAFDLARRALADSEKLLSGEFGILAQPRLLIIDSGGYELLPRLTEQADGSVVEHCARWTAADYEQLLGQLPAELDIAIVSFDRPEHPFDVQIAAAHELFARFPGRSGVCLLKPDRSAEPLSVSRLRPHIADMRPFKVIGVTEKELGHTLRERLSKVAELRTALDDEQLSAPIHIFGGLDPVMTPLFYAAGAEIFDGLTWLRYGYFKGISAYRQSVALLRDDLEAPERLRQWQTELDNLQELRSLKNKLRELHRHDDWSVLGEHHQQLQHAYRRAMTYLREN